MNDPRYHSMDGEEGLSSGEQPCDPRLHAPATQRNREPILDVLSRVLPGSGIVLELASGTGEHAIWLAQHLRPLVWQPSDADPDMRRSIDAHARFAGARNIRPALAIDVTSRPWPIESASAAVCVNLLHISPWTATEGVFAGCAEILPAGAPIAIYGPFKRHGQHTAESNARFDSSLRASDPSWGVRDVDNVSTVAERHGFVLEEIVEMPANNLILVFRRQG